jgi:hypothetical protein
MARLTSMEQREAADGLVRAPLLAISYGLSISGNNLGVLKSFSATASAPSAVERRGLKERARVWSSDLLRNDEQ